MTKVLGVSPMVLLAFLSVPCFAQDDEDKPPEPLPFPAEAKDGKSAPDAVPPQVNPPVDVPYADDLPHAGRAPGESCLHHLLAWATYHPVTHSCAGCVHHCAPCCYPPLYTFFPCPGFGGCGPQGCSSCGEAAGPCTKDCFRIFHHHRE